MKRSLLVAVVVLGGLAQAQVTLRPGTLQLTIPPQPTLLQPAQTFTINGLSNSVFSASLRGTGSLPSTGQVAYPQSFPATSNRTSVPQTLSLTPTSTTTDEQEQEAFTSSPVFAAPGVMTASGPDQPSVADYSCATARPDFRYRPGKLNFEAESTSNLGQVDMNFWSGLPSGTNRYVPLGEF